MNVFDEKVKALEFFQENKERIILELIKDIEPLILDLNTAQLEDQGIDSDGADVVPGYRPKTIEIKKQKGQTTTHVTLKDTGSFHDSFFVVYGRNYFAIGSDHPLAKKLEKKYGPEIFGLISENVGETIEHIRPELIIKLKETL